VLAVHALNVNPTSTDMLLVAKLEKNSFDYEQAIGDVVDLDAFFRFWAVESLLGFWDGYSGNRNNYFFYLDAGSGKIHFIPWGADALFEKYSPIDRTPNLPLSVKTQGRVAYRLYQRPATRNRYARTMRDVMERYWDERALLAETERIEEMLLPHLSEGSGKVPGAEAGRGARPTRTAGQRFKPSALRQFIRTRRAELLAEMSPQMPVWTRSPGEPPTIGPDVPPAEEKSTDKAADGETAPARQD
jgi:spore coat protein CotH